MHKDDQMTPNERADAFINGKPMDRLMIIPFLTNTAARVLGISFREERSSARKMADAQIASYDRFGQDGISIEYTLHGIGAAMGTKMTDPVHDVQAIEEQVLKDLEDLNTLDFSLAYVDKDTWLRQALEAASICMRERGDEVSIGFGIPGPFSAANSIYPLEKLLKATRKQPELVHQLLRKCTDVIKHLALEGLAIGADISIGDPVASGTILSVKQYREFVKPYTAEINQAVIDVGSSCTYHICGDTSSIVMDMIETGCGVLSVDNTMDMEVVKKQVGHLVPIIGNVDPVGVFQSANREEIFEATRVAIAKSYDNPMGYMIATGCDIAGNAPLESVDLFMEAGRYYGKIPLDSKLIGKI